jgi:hypothetical protein
VERAAFFRAGTTRYPVTSLPVRLASACEFQVFGNTARETGGEGVQPRGGRYCLTSHVCMQTRMQEWNTVRKLMRYTAPRLPLLARSPALDPTSELYDRWLTQDRTVRRLVRFAMCGIRVETHVSGHETEPSATKGFSRCRCVPNSYTHNF